MRCSIPILILVLAALLALAGYNYMQINRMRSELAGIKAKVHNIGSAEANKQNLLTALAEVRKHTTRARSLLRSGQGARARAELDRSLQDLGRASKLSQDAAADAGSGLGGTWSTVRKEVERAWKEVSRQIEEGRPGGNGPRNR